MSAPLTRDSHAEEEEDEGHPHAGAPLPSSPGYLQALLVGALTPGVNKPTWAAANVCLLLVIATAALLVLPLALTLQPGPHQRPLEGEGRAPVGNAPLLPTSVDLSLVIHVTILVLLALALIFLLNWLISATGTVSVSDQMKEAGALFDDGKSDKTE